MHSVGSQHGINPPPAEITLLSTTELHDVTVICVTYNSSLVLPAMAQILAKLPEVIIVDNASTDTTVEQARALVPHARVIARKENSGFGAANNEGMSHARTPYALLLNPDCQISPADICILRDCLRTHPQAGIVGPQGWRSATVPQKSYRPAFNQAQPDGPYQIPEKVTPTGWLHGSCLLVRRSAFEQIGGFDPTFFLYYEDDDLCLRMQQARWQCLLEPGARSEHFGGRSSTPSSRTTFIKQFHYARSRQIALARYAGALPALAHRWRLLLAWLPAIMLYALLLRRQDLSKWSGWGLAACCAVFHLDGLAARIR